MQGISEKQQPTNLLPQKRLHSERGALPKEEGKGAIKRINEILKVNQQIEENLEESKESGEGDCRVWKFILNELRRYTVIKSDALTGRAQSLGYDDAAFGEIIEELKNINSGIRPRKQVKLIIAGDPVKKHILLKALIHTLKNLIRSPDDKNKKKTIDKCLRIVDGILDTLDLVKSAPNPTPDPVSIPEPNPDQSQPSQEPSSQRVPALVPSTVYFGTYPILLSYLLPPLPPKSPLPIVVDDEEDKDTLMVLPDDKEDTTSAFYAYSPYY